ncbi:EmrB/QacA subfamily drug resistance transporter [Sediminihabitans luteus]|uniref:EmrB/QacA subfamily drug resistance transporter n=1 Tax=Sediminihabitans luteus TaxID=1138585 RepID=A0A2M9CC60_9CELL|nr:MDR family MFS transporter [Sediminihabitans luteus]PJJ68600.1 EmrB/QacA subfamily drug resistance transporter [Sediminihabitans luteus]GII99938.1 EmrB/QacA family drug resistance transporter [Sediminihabitans luteus]
MTTQTEPEALPQGKIYAIFGGLMLAMLLAALDQTIVSTALPTIVADLGGAEHLSWVVTSYMLASTATTPLWGKLGDLYGRKILFIACIVIFLVGSILAGTSQSMGQLIAWRAVQGAGGGGLMVLAQAIIGDVVPPRERGKYQGFFGAVFGVSSVAGPLLGGWFVDNLDWRWVFYINVPIGIVALVVVTAVLPLTRSGRHPKIDYAGILLLATVATSIVLVTSLGGVTWEWDSAQVWGTIALGVVALVAFVLVEQRAAEPVLPLRLFRNRVFSTTAAVGFVIGFAMFGAITFLPLYLQQIKGATPTESGLQMIPMMVGMLFTSIGSGQLISRTGRYKIFPIIGTFVTAGGLFLLSTMDRGTSTLESSLYMFVLGFGLGLVMQVLVLAVQNAVEYKDLGTATSGATFFRTIGSSVGVAVFGSVLTRTLTDQLSTDVPAGAQGPCGGDVLAQSAIALGQCPPEVQGWFLDGYAFSIHTVFLFAVPVALLAFLLTFLIPEVRLRSGADRADAGTAAGEVFALPSQRTSLEELRLILWRRVGVMDPLRVYRVLVRDTGVDLSPEQCWMLTRAAIKGPRSVQAMSEVSGASTGTVQGVAESLAERGLVTVEGDTVTATDAGLAEAEVLSASERERLRRYVDEWPGESEPAIDELVEYFTSALLTDGPALPVTEPETRDR